MSEFQLVRIALDAQALEECMEKNRKAAADIRTQNIAEYANDIIAAFNDHMIDATKWPIEVYRNPVLTNREMVRVLGRVYKPMGFLFSSDPHEEGHFFLDRA